MKYLLELISNVNSKNIINRGAEIIPNSALPSLLGDILGKTQPFVYLVNKETEPLDSEEYEESKVSFDSPFQTFSAECLNGYISIPRPEDEEKYVIKCIVSHEISPNKCIFLSLLTNLTTHKNMVIVNNLPEVAGIMKHFVERLNCEHIGIQKVSQKVKIKTSEGNNFVKFRKISYVYTKKSQKSPEFSDFIRKNGILEPKSSTHRWFSRGHWRTLNPNSLGKDREDNYIIPGNTWVRESIKGDKSAPLIIKPHLVR